MKQDPTPVVCTLAGHRVDAVSVAGVQTCLQLPAFDLCFDIGRCPVSAVHQRTVLVTHGHVDHLGGVVHHVALRAMWGLRPSRIVVHEGIRQDVDELFAVWRRISHTPLPLELVGMAPGERLDLGKGLAVRGVAASHRVPTLAYVLEKTRRRLRPELANLPGPAIAARRKAGEEVTVEHTGLEVGFTADSRAALLDREPDLLRARLLICECTFVDDPREAPDPAVADRADRTGHMQLQDLADRADRFENEAILLTHFSTRYGPSRVRDALATLPDGLRGRVTALPLTPG